MKKRGQLTAFIIIGIVIVAIIILLLATQYSKLKQVQKQEISETTSFQPILAQINSLIENCIKEEAKNALDLYGLYESKISTHIQSHIAQCAEPLLNSYREKSIEITAQSPTSTTTLTNENINLNLNYPLTLKKGSIDDNSLKEFSASLKRKITLKIPLSPQGFTTEYSKLITEDGNAELTLEQGTFVKDSYAQPLKEISIKLNNCPDYPCFGPLDYELLPKGASFDPKATLTIKYNEKFLKGYKEQDLRIARYDENSKLYIPYESYVDTLNNIIIAKIDKF